MSKETDAFRKGWVLSLGPSLSLKNGWCPKPSHNNYDAIAIVCCEAGGEELQRVSDLAAAQTLFSEILAMETSRGDSEPPPAHRGRGKGAENLPYMAHSRPVGHHVGCLGKYCVELKNVRYPISMSRGQLLWELRGSGVSQGTVVLQTKLLYLRKLSLFNQNGRAV